jgi:methylated-DNA-protein-cysteine methyltransferase-like protein
MMKPNAATQETRRPEHAMAAAICDTIRSIARGKVATYGQVAEAAGYPRCHRQVAQVLRKFGHSLPWYRVLGSGGQLKTRRDSMLEQRMRLEFEGVRFRGSRVDMALHQNTFASLRPKRKAPKQLLRDRSTGLD